MPSPFLRSTNGSPTKAFKSQKDSVKKFQLTSICSKINVHLCYCGISNDYKKNIDNVLLSE